MSFCRSCGGEMSDGGFCSMCGVGDEGGGGFQHPADSLEDMDDGSKHYRYEGPREEDALEERYQESESGERLEELLEDFERNPDDWDTE